MKIAKTIFTLAAAGTLFAGTALAEPFSQQSTLGFPAETQGIAHVDIDAMNASEIGKILREQLEKKSSEFADDNQPKMIPTDEDNLRTLLKLLLEFSKKATSITAANLGDDQAIFYVRGNVEIAKIFEIVTGKKLSKTDKKALGAFGWPMPPERELFFTKIDKKTIAITCAKTKEDEKKLRTQFTKNRKAKTTAKIDFKTPKSSLAFVNSKIPQDANGAGTPGNLPAERIFVNLAEAAGTLKLTADLTFPSEEMAQMMHAQLAQLVPLAPMMITANPALASQPNALELSQKIATGTKVSQAAKIVTISAALPVEVLKTLATAVPASVPEADDVFGD